MMSASTKQGSYISILNIIQGDVDASQVFISISILFNFYFLDS